jgi:hypothetical protein
LKSCGRRVHLKEAEDRKIHGLAGVRRLIRSATDAEDGNRDDLAKEVDGKLYPRDK